MQDLETSLEKNIPRCLLSGGPVGYMKMCKNLLKPLRIIGSCSIE